MRVGRMGRTSRALWAARHSFPAQSAHHNQGKTVQQTDLPLTCEALRDAQLPVRRVYKDDWDNICVVWELDPAKWQKRAAEHAIYADVQVRHLTVGLATA